MLDIEFVTKNVDVESGGQAVSTVAEIHAMREILRAIMT